MRTVLICFLIAVLLISNSIAAAGVPAMPPVRASGQESTSGSPRKDHPIGVSEFDRLRTEGFDAVYNIDYKTARQRFLQMTKIAPDHPAGYVYLANNLWLETLFQSRRLTT